MDGHGPTLVAIDERGEATRPAITFLDARAAAEAAELEAATGVQGWGLGPLPAALWLERHEPAAADATRWYLSTWEWLAFRLTGEAVAPIVPNQAVPDLAIAGRATGLHVERRPRPGTMGAIQGHLTAAAADALGLRAGIPVASGTNDAFASYLGAGLLEPGDAYDPGGSAGGFGVYWDVPIVVPGAFVAPAPLEGRYSVGAAMAATGRALDWYRDAILGGTITIDALIAEAAATPPGADGLVFLPYLAGERSPLWDPQARGVFAGLTLAHGRGHLARAILEASALAIRHVAAPMLAAGVRVTEMRVCGGPARSDTWNAIKADVTGFTVAVPAVLETAGPGQRDPRGGGDRGAPGPARGHRGDDPDRSSHRPATRDGRHLRSTVRGVRGLVSGDESDPARTRRARGSRMSGDLRLTDIAVSFPGPGRTRHSAVHGIDLSIASGSVVALIGPNGCGKSTLLRVIAGLLTPDRGAVVLRRRPARRPGSPHRPGLPGAAAAAVAHGGGQHHLPARTRRLVARPSSGPARRDHRSSPA